MGKKANGHSGSSRMARSIELTYQCGQNIICCSGKESETKIRLHYKACAMCKTSDGKLPKLLPIKIRKIFNGTGCL